MKISSFISVPSSKPRFAQALLAICAAVFLQAASSALADDTKEKAKSETDASAVKVLITGSRLPQKVMPGRIPGTAAPVTIITQKQIERTGAVTVMDVLRRTGNGR